MKSINFTLIFILIFSFELSHTNTAYASDYHGYTPASYITIQQVALDKNNINSWLINTGIFDRDLRTSGTPGFEWPKYTGQDAIFSSGLSIAAMYSGALRMASSSYTGEFAPGYVTDSAGISVARTDSRFKIYAVIPSDPNSYDWQHWGDMVPYGAPYTDINHNGIYEPATDIPGMPGAAKTLFVCLTDGFASQHTPGEGFGGGTAPLYAEVHLVAWVYNTSAMQDVQFLKWDIYNKSHVAWNSTYFSVVCDPDLGCSDDDLIGCDTSRINNGQQRNLGFVYNSQEVDCAGSYRYTAIVPSAGIVLLEGAINRSVNPPVQLQLTSFDYFTNPSAGGPVCEQDPNPGANYAYNYMKGLKKDQTPWVFPPGGAGNVTKFCYPGDPEMAIGWCERQSTVSGSVQNCGGPNVYNGNYVSSNPGGDRRFLMNSGADNFTVNTGEKQTIAVAQMIAVGVNRRNSVTHLKALCSQVWQFYLIGVKTVSDKVPEKYLLYQNYPNPFNPSTTIKYQIMKKGFVGITIYDAIGRQVETLVSLSQSPGTYEVQWNASAYPSGVYFYKFTAGSYSETKKLILLK